jgi:hypothetical protein
MEQPKQVQEFEWQSPKGSFNSCATPIGFQTEEEIEVP